MTQERSEVEQIFAGNSEMATLMKAHDWSPTPLGSISGWASSLKTAVSICLNSRFPMVIWWGKQLVMLYNDAWRPIQGTKHPKALQQVQTLEQVRQIPALVLTAYAGEVDRQQAIQAEFQTHLSKPIKP
jgi:hypothetical protein